MTGRPVTPTAILAAELTDLSDLVADLPADALPADFGTRLAGARDLVTGLDRYPNACTTGESTALRALARRTGDTDWDGTELEAEMLTGHVVGQLLSFLVHVTGARRVLDIGMFSGYSSLAMAEALLPGGLVVACEVDEQVAETARAAFADTPAGERISVTVGPALDTLARLAADRVAPFDLIFLDADKPGYADYLAAILDQGLLADRGLIAVDNTLMQGEPWLHAEDPDAMTANGRAIAEFNHTVLADPRVVQVMLTVRDGITLLRHAGHTTNAPAGQRG